MSTSNEVQEKVRTGDASPGRILITGGCGFIGSNLAAHYLAKGWEVIAYDNFSRPGARINADWLSDLNDGRFSLIRADVRDLEALSKAMQGVDVVAHLAAQVAVTTSIQDPLEDFYVNVLGGIHVLEAARTCGSDPIVLYASTNKVYGGMEKLQVGRSTLRYHLLEYPKGIPEDFPIDLHSPYGCSKGACDLYMIDYARIFGLRTVVFRQSCIYGPRQFGIEDQGWVAHFVISSALERPITIYGDGRQTRDVLHVGDLLQAFDRAVERIDVCRGQVYNLGGGPRNTVSLLEMIYRLESLMDKAIPLHFGNWRTGDQRIYVSDIRKVGRDLDWEPRISMRSGLEDLCDWVQANKEILNGTILDDTQRVIENTRSPVVEVGT